MRPRAPKRIAWNPAHTRPQAPQRAPVSAKRTHKCVSLAWACGEEWEERVRVRGGLEHPAGTVGACGRLLRGSAARPQLGFLARHCMHLTSLASSAIRRTRQMGLGLTVKNPRRKVLKFN